MTRAAEEHRDRLRVCLVPAGAKTVRVTNVCEQAPFHAPVYFELTPEQARTVAAELVAAAEEVTQAAPPSDVSETAAASEPTGGWQWPAGARKAHYFTEPGRVSRCGRYTVVLTGRLHAMPDAEWGERPRSECVVCRRKLRLAAMQGGAQS
jgi:hypothetical protein